ncbi:alpha/beta-hydrolase [Rhizopogon vinicolor AM-OR11-026]|uniref:Alpha/beta-hydrolase n=1 Tax=Rhizopogon vinicolor AM-OR11-026 TaxID=1314800 RepID=A0A1B7MGJ9_9AGAM|nr:alpha/beta-hydrolase [Rhizopogon vinicolor AM-OR11-026]
MLFLQPILLWLAAYCGFVADSPLDRRAAPTVTLDTATVTGVASCSVNEWLGIPFALPPETGNFRFQPPQPIPSYNTSFSATTYGPSCPQQNATLSIPPGLHAETLDYLTPTVSNITVSEDCLTVNVVAPADATPESNLPVAIWIFGRGLESGSTRASPFDGSVVVNNLIALSVPVVYVRINYRLTAFGFLASEEVKQTGVGNLGLQDQQQAMRWVQKYINAFGGDPCNVTTVHVT